MTSAVWRSFLDCWGSEGQLSTAQVRVVCGLQVDKIPNVQPTEPAIWIDELVDPEETSGRTQTGRTGSPHRDPGQYSKLRGSRPPPRRKKEGKSGRPGKGLGIT